MSQTKSISDVMSKSIDSIEDKATVVTDEMLEKLGNAKNSAASGAKNLAEKVTDSAEDVVSGVSSGVSTATDFVSNKVEMVGNLIEMYESKLVTPFTVISVLCLGYALWNMYKNVDLTDDNVVTNKMLFNFGAVFSILVSVMLLVTGSIKGVVNSMVSQMNVKAMFNRNVLSTFLPVVNIALMAYSLKMVNDPTHYVDVTQPCCYAVVGAVATTGLQMVM